MRKIKQQRVIFFSPRVPDANFMLNIHHPPTVVTATPFKSPATEISPHSLQ